ncbi:carbohydrate kinase family protein [Arthrobacter agilis]|uniref:carbohydrate kinase family protein n=1 Tax=Arthrobacter agilis TaxID=37921 RepID=UPI002785FB17|nr:carbohydrate kinase [Arthrobacter agilis]MDQ0736720.1 fructokinase [Arthrobacter agilis]
MITVVGETLIDEVISDITPMRAHVGGSPMNVAVGLARLGHPAQFVGRYGDDGYGRMIEQHLRDNSVPFPVEPDTSPTSVATARLDPAGGASYDFQLVWDLPGLAAQRDRLLDGTTLLHTGSIATMLAPGADDVLALVTAAHPLVTVTYDPNCRPTIIRDAAFARSQAERFVALADVVKASDEDLGWLYPDRSPEDSARAWLDAGAAVVVVTRGSKGPWGVSRAGEASVPAPSTSVVDTVGAGDSFMAALVGALVDLELDGAHRRDELRRITLGQLTAVLQYAARAAAITVSRAGANPPSRDEMARQA